MKEGRVAVGKPTFACHMGGCCCRAEASVLPQVRCRHSKPRCLHFTRLLMLAARAGIGLGAMLSSCTKLRDEQFIAAAEAVARMVTREDLARGAMFPPLNSIREVRRPTIYTLL